MEAEVLHKLDFLITKFGVEIISLILKIGANNIDRLLDFPTDDETGSHAVYVDPTALDRLFVLD